MGGGTEAFPDLGSHCRHPDCHQLDFLHFSCNSCHKVFYLEHKSVVVCEICSLVIETTGHDEEEKKKTTYPVRRCKEPLTFSNTSSCKICRIKVCLRHRFGNLRLPSPMAAGNNKFLEALIARNGKDCGNRAALLLRTRHQLSMHVDHSVQVPTIMLGGQCNNFISFL